MIVKHNIIIYLSLDHLFIMNNKYTFGNHYIYYSHLSRKLTGSKIHLKLRNMYRTLEFK